MQLRIDAGSGVCMLAGITLWIGNRSAHGQGGTAGHGVPLAVWGYLRGNPGRRPNNRAAVCSLGLCARLMG